ISRYVEHAKRFVHGVMQQSKRLFLQVLFFAYKQIQGFNPPFLDLLAKIVVGASACSFFRASAHRPSIIVEMIVCANSFAMRSTAGFSSLKNDCGSSDSWYSPSKDILGFSKMIFWVLRSRTTTLTMMRTSHMRVRPRSSRMVPSVRKDLMSPLSTASALSWLLTTLRPRARFNISSMTA